MWMWKEGRKEGRTNSASHAFIIISASSDDPVPAYLTTELPINFNFHPSTRKFLSSSSL